MAFLKKEKKEKKDDRFSKILWDTVEKVYNSSDYKERRENMNRWLKEFQGEWYKKEWMSDNPNESKAFCNYFFSTVMSVAPLLTDNRPIWGVRARKPHLQNYMELWSAGLEYLWDKLDMDRKVYLTALDSLVFYNGIMKVRYDAEEDDVAHDVIDPRTFFIADGFTDPWEAPWCGERKQVSMAWIKMHYPDKFEDVVPDGKDGYDHDNKYDIELQRDLVTIQELWLRDDSIIEYFEENDGVKEKKQKQAYPNGRIVIQTKTLILEDKPSEFNHGKAPYALLYDYDVPHSAWGMGEAVQIEELNREYNRRLQTLVKHAHRTNDPNYIVDAGSGLDPDQVKREMDSGGNVWAVNAGVTDPIKEIKSANLNNVHMNLLSGIPVLIEEVTGVTDISKGQAPKKQRQSASEVSILIESSYTRVRQRVRNLEWFIKRVLYLDLCLMQQFYTEPRTVTYKRGENLNFLTIGNSKAIAEESVMPQPNPEEKENEYQDRVMSDEDYLSFIEEFGDVDEVYAEFDLEIQTNSTLPIDQQSLANLYLRLAQIQVTPDSIVDDEAVLEGLRVPNSDRIMKRKQRMKSMMMAGGGSPQGAPPQVGGNRGITTRTGETQ